MKIAIIDNYDSFTYNLVAIMREVTDDYLVMRNDQIDHDYIKKCSHVVLSPGPGIPDEAGELKQVIKTYAETKKILGICLGHQAIAEVFGARLINLNSVCHGIASKINFQNDILFKGLENGFEAGRYHSWVVDFSAENTGMEVIATDVQGQIMGLRHSNLPIRGIQFHPESILTSKGDVIIKNFIES